MDSPEQETEPITQQFAELQPPTTPLMEPSPKPRHLRSLSADAASALQFRRAPQQDEALISSSFQSPAVTGGDLEELGITPTCGWKVTTNEFAVVEEIQAETQRRQSRVESRDLIGRRLFDGSRTPSDGNWDSSSDGTGYVGELNYLEYALRGLVKEFEELEPSHGAMVEHDCGSGEEGRIGCGQCCCRCYSCTGSCVSSEQGKTSHSDDENLQEKLEEAVKELVKQKNVEENEVVMSNNGRSRTKLWMVCLIFALMASVLSIVRSLHSIGEDGDGVMSLVPT